MDLLKSDKILVTSCCLHSNDSWNSQKCVTKHAFFKLLDTIGVCKIKINVATSEYGNIDPPQIYRSAHENKDSSQCWNWSSNQLASLITNHMHVADLITTQPGNSLPVTRLEV